MIAEGCPDALCSAVNAQTLSVFETPELER